MNIIYGIIYYDTIPSTHHQKLSSALLIFALKYDNNLVLCVRSWIFSDLNLLFYHQLCVFGIRLTFRTANWSIFYKHCARTLLFALNCSVKLWTFFNFKINQLGFCKNIVTIDGGNIFLAYVLYLWKIAHIGNFSIQKSICSLCSQKNIKKSFFLILRKRSAA